MGLRRSWPSIALSDVRPRLDGYGTYSPFAWDGLPPVPAGITGDYGWLAASPAHGRSTLGMADDAAHHDISEWDTWPGLTSDLHVPGDFAEFARNPELRRHLRSATACYFDLGDHSVKVPGGHLVHFLSDSQWVLHWLMFSSESGEQAVVVTQRPAGFDRSPVIPDPSADSDGYLICADTFPEFIWRFWIENEIWYALRRDKRTLTPAEAHYVQHYAV